MEEILREVAQVALTTLVTGIVAIFLSFLPRICKVIGRTLRKKSEELPPYVRSALFFMVAMIEKKFPDLPGQEQKTKVLDRAKERFPWLDIISLDKGIEEGWDQLKAAIKLGEVPSSPEPPSAPTG